MKIEDSCQNDLNYFNINNALRNSSKVKDSTLDVTKVWKQYWAVDFRTQVIGEKFLKFSVLKSCDISKKM